MCVTYDLTFERESKAYQLSEVNYHMSPTLGGIHLGYSDLMSPLFNSRAFILENSVAKLLCDNAYHQHRRVSPWQNHH